MDSVSRKQREKARAPDQTGGESLGTETWDGNLGRKPGTDRDVPGFFADQCGDVQGHRESEMRDRQTRTSVRTDVSLGYAANLRATVFIFLAKRLA